MSYKRCSKCGEDNQAGAINCIVCGESLKNSELITTKDIEAAVVRCPNCNEMIKSNIRTCPNCAFFIAKTSFENISNNNYMVNQSGISGFLKALLYITSFIIPLIGIIIGIVFIAGANEDMRPLGKSILIFSLIITGIFILGLLILR